MTTVRTLRPVLRAFLRGEETAAQLDTLRAVGLVETLPAVPGILRSAPIGRLTALGERVLLGSDEQADLAAARGSFDPAA